MGKFPHPHNDILMIVNTLAKTLSTPKEQDIEMPPVHEKVAIGGKKCKLTGIYDESDDFRFAQATASIMNPGSKIAPLPGEPQAKKRDRRIGLFRVPSGIRTHDIQNHNLTL